MKTDRVFRERVIEHFLKEQEAEYAEATAELNSSTAGGRRPGEFTAISPTAT